MVRRYGSVAFIEGLKAERRRGLLLGFAGAGILIGLVALYVFGFDREVIPEVPADPTPLPRAPGEVVAPSLPAPREAQAPAAPDEPKDATPPAELAGPPAPDPSVPTTAKVDITASQAVALWIDDEPAGKRKGLFVELPAGRHEVRARVGKKTLTHVLVVTAGERYEVHLDAKKDRFTARRVPPASGHASPPK